MPRVSSLIVKPPRHAVLGTQGGRHPAVLSFPTDSQGEEGFSGSRGQLRARSVVRRPLGEHSSESSAGAPGVRRRGSAVTGLLRGPGTAAVTCGPCSCLCAIFLQMPSSFLLRSGHIPSSSPTGRPSRPDTARLSLWPIPPPVPFPRRQLPGPSIASPSPMPGHQGSLNNTLHPSCPTRA